MASIKELRPFPCPYVGASLCRTNAGENFYFLHSPTMLIGFQLHEHIFAVRDYFKVRWCYLPFPPDVRHPVSKPPSCFSCFIASRIRSRFPLIKLNDAPLPHHRGIFLLYFVFFHAVLRHTSAALFSPFLSISFCRSSPTRKSDACPFLL